MPRLVVKVGFTKNKNTAAGYMQYVATRDGVELLDAPTPTEGYMEYIAKRPHAERHGEHGLFSSKPAVSLKDAMNEVRNHTGNVWTVICSLKREDAARLGYDSAEKWRSLIMRHQAEIADAMKIPVDSLRWYAAYHDEGHHPHIHMMAWDASPKQHSFLTKGGIERIRSVLTNDIFKDEMHELYRQKDLSYKEVVAESRKVMSALVRSMKESERFSESIAQKLVALSNELKSVSGRKVYGYLPKPLKALVDEIVDEIAVLPDVSRCYAAWNKLRDDLEGYYKSTPREHNPLSRQKEFRAIKNAIVREAIALGSPANSHRQHPSVAQSVIRLIREVGRVFQDNSIPPRNPLGIRVDSKRRKMLLAKRMAMGHKMDDHEDAVQEQWLENKSH